MPELCSRCQAPIHAEGSMGLSLHGFGDAGIVDTFNLSCEAVLCEACARAMFQAEPWLLKAASPALNINYGHECLDGTIHWVPQSQCQIDPDLHGWRKVFIVTPKSELRPPHRAPLVTPMGLMARYGVFDAREEAERLSDDLSKEGVACRVTESHSGTERHHGAIVEPSEWLEWWGTHNTKWLRKAKINHVCSTTVMIVRNPLRTANWFAKQTLRRVISAR